MTMMERKRILIVEVNWIGDVLFSTPFIRAVREAYPDAYIACLLHPRCREVLEGNPRLDEIIVYDEEGEHRSILGKVKLILSLRKRHFDTAFLLHRSFTKALIAFLAGAKERIGYPTKRRSFLLTTIAEISGEEPHKVEYFLDVARAAGITPKSRSYEFFITDSHRNAMKTLLAQNGAAGSGRLAVMCPGGNWDPKRWPKDNFALLADALIGRYGVSVVISGTQKDTGLAADIAGMMKNKPVILCGKTTLKEMAALFESSELVVANDTGTMHLAVAMKAKVIALFGPTSPRLTGPYGEGRYRVIVKQDECEVPCYDLSCTDNRCMAAIKVEDVLREAEEVLRVH